MIVFWTNYYPLVFMCLMIPCYQDNYMLHMTFYLLELVLCLQCVWLGFY